MLMKLTFHSPKLRVFTCYADLGYMKIENNIFFQKNRKQKCKVKYKFKKSRKKILLEL